jgi:hypothetical protein
MVTFGAAPSLEELPERKSSKGGKFSVVGQESGRNVHMIQFAKKKIGKIYPRLAERKYGEPKPTLEEILSRTV